MEYLVDEPAVDQWARSIGKLMINYSALEAEIDRWLVHLSERAYTGAEVTSERSRGFQQKRKEVAKLARRRSPSEEWLTKAQDRLERAKAIAQVRDQVAHAPLYYVLRQQNERRAESVIIPPTPRQRQLRQTASLDYRGLQTAVDDSAKVVTELSNLFQQWRNAHRAGNVQLDPRTLPVKQRFKRIAIYWWRRIREA